MKKIRIALAVSVALAATAAHAQTSVTLYGLIDAGITYTNNVGGSSRVALASGNISGSRFGLRGTEDLGGGLKALFVLENGFNVNNGTLGQGGRMFGRQAYVGLSSNSFGRPARNTPSPIAIQLASAASYGNVSVPAKAACSGL